MAKAAARSGAEPLLLAALSAEDPERVDAIASRVLDAAYAVIERQGAQRMTMEEVAREAGISRITVYRRFATKDALVEQVVTREFRRYFAQFRADVARGRSAEERVVIGFMSSLRTMRDNPLIGGLMSGERGVLLTSLLAESATLDVVRGFVAQQLRREQAAGQVDARVDPDFVAEIMVRLTTSFLVTPSSLVDVEDEAALRRVAEQALIPLLHL
jgi:AcrR family transcriptional regulator